MSATESHIDVRTALKHGLAQLRDEHVSSYTLAAELLLLHVLGRAAPGFTPTRKKKSAPRKQIAISR